ncbi:MAG: LysM peptidoglycan-binding domain-containing protein [Candidatus Melainabacteria bacterium]|nr:LysM peptidoglycan-binding domain-containing protein [Candidatus Melainabacteria bacterium]
MSLNFRPQTFSSPSTGADITGAGGHELLKGSLSAGAEATVGSGIGQVDMSQMQVSFRPDAAAASALPSGIELTGAVAAPTGMEAQALASFAPPPMDASPMVAALAGANEPISPIIQLIMRMPGAMGLMNSFFEALGQFLFAQSPLAGLFDHTLFAQWGAVSNQMGKVGLPGSVGLEHSAINLSLLPQNAPIFSNLGTLGSMGGHALNGNFMPFDSLTSKFATAPQLNVSPEHFSGINKLNVSGGLDLNKPQFEWSSKFTGQNSGGSYGEMLSGPQLSDGKLASHLGGTQRLFSDKLQASSGLANRMPLNQPAIANNGVNQSLSQSVPLSNNVPSLNVNGQSYGGSTSGGLSASGSMRDIAAPSADNNVSYRMGQMTGADAASLDAAQTSMDASGTDKLLAYNNNNEGFRPTLGGMDKGVQAASDSGSQWNQPQSVAKPAIKMEGLKAKQLTFDSLKEGSKAHSAAQSTASASHHAAAAKPVMDYQGHQLRAGGVNAGHGMDGISHRNLHGVQYHKPTAGHSIAKPQHAAEAKPVQEFKSQQVAQNQSDLGQTQDAVNQAAPQDAAQAIGDQAVAPASATAAPSSYTIRAGDCLWNIAKNQLGDGMKWQDIFNANKDILGSNPDLIHPGTTINLPGQEVAANQAGNYVVKSGDSLWKISQDLLGDGTRWNELYQANASIIGDNPRLIMPGQELSIPGMDGADTLAQGAATTGTQTAQAAGQQTIQSATQVPGADAQFSTAQPQGMEAPATPQTQQTQQVLEVPQVQEQSMQVPQASGAGAANAQPAAYQQQAPANYQQLPAANLPADGKNSVVSSTMVPTDIVEMFKKAK